MKESLWAYWLIILGVFVIVGLLLVQSYTSTNTQDYYLVKTITEASMEDAIDWSYYRLYGEVKINKEKFYESFLRRFAEETSMATTYDIEFTTVYEAPPKVGVKISSKSSTFSIAGDSTTFDIVNKIDAILENKTTASEPAEENTPVNNGEQNEGNTTTPEYPSTGGEDEDSINAVRYDGCKAYFITTCTETVCNYTKEDDQPKTGTIERNKLNMVKNNNCDMGEGETETACKDEEVEDFDASDLYGYSMYKLNVRSKPNTSGKVETTLAVGDEIKIAGKVPGSTWWKVEYDGGKCGFVNGEGYVAVNLQSYFSKNNVSNVSFNITNQNSSIFKADVSGTRICSKSGECLDGMVFYSGGYKPIATYTFAKKLKNAIKSTSRTVVIYDTYRPLGAANRMGAIFQSYLDYVAPKAYHDAVRSYRGKRDGGNYTTGAAWFLVSGESTHTTGCAADLTLSGVEMPTPIHTLNPASGESNAGEKELHSLMGSAGLTSISSEWWHYEDMSCHNTLKGVGQTFWSR